MGQMREEPESGHVTADERRIAELLRAVEAPAPATLHAFTEQLVADRQPRPRSARLRRRIIIVDSMALAAAAVAVVLGLIFAAGSSPRRRFARRESRWPRRAAPRRTHSSPRGRASPSPTGPRAAGRPRARAATASAGAP